VSFESALRACACGLLLQYRVCMSTGQPLKTSYLLRVHRPPNRAPHALRPCTVGSETTSSNHTKAYLYCSIVRSAKYIYLFYRSIDLCERSLPLVLRCLE
jgi:hypothetical protein